MKNLKDTIKDQLNEIVNYNIPEQDMMTEMANLSRKCTNLPVIIWVEAGCNKRYKK